jgi:hypothetical protein
MVSVHALEPEYAYDQTQCDERITSGDTLVAENVVGFMLDAWPVAVTIECGQFHSIAAGGDPAQLAKQSRMQAGAIEAAVQYAHERGLAIQPEYANV